MTKINALFGAHIVALLMLGAPHACRSETNLSVSRALFDTFNHESTAGYTSVFVVAIPLNIWLLDPSRPDAQMIINFISDQMISANWITERSKRSLFEGYTELLKTAEWGKLPLNDAEKAEYGQLLTKLFIDAI